MKESHERAQALWPIVRFDDAFVPASDFGLHLDKSNYAASGAYPVIDQGEAFIGGYTDDARKVYRGQLPVILFGDHTRRAKLVDFPFVVGAQGIKILRPSKSFEPRFLTQLVSTLPITDRGYGRHYALLRQQQFLCPPMVDQIRIVAEIEKQFTRLDAGVAALRRAQANLKRYRASVLKAACEGKLVPTEAELARAEGREYESGAALLERILIERRAAWAGRGKYKEPAAPDVAGLPGLPEGCCWATVEQLGEVQLGRQRSPKHVSKDFPTKYIRAANITNAGLSLDDVLEMEFSLVERERYRLQHGDIVLSEASGSASQVGKPAMWRDELPMCCFQNTVIRLRPVLIGSNYVLTTFQHFYTNGVFSQIAGGVGINHLGAEKFSAIPFPLPPLTEQQRIVAEVERRLSVIDELEAIVAANLQRAARLRQAVLQRAFSGEL